MRYVKQVNNLQEKLMITDAMAAAKKEIDAALSLKVPGLGEMTSYLAASRGKGLRALLLLTAASDAEGNIPADAAKAAAALELMHMATLVHDDVIDNADIRRGMPALHQKFGTRNAVICGDYLLSQSMLMCANLDVSHLNDSEDHFTPMRRISKALSAVCRGEYKQHLNLGNFDMNIFTYLKIVSGKTAALFYVSAYIGATLAGEPAKIAQDMGHFGRRLGMVFQILDDCKDYEWTQDQALKPVGNDIKSGVITLPLIFAMRKNPELRKLAKEAMMTKRDTDDFIQSVRDTGGVSEARALAEQYAVKAVQVLKDVSPGKREALLKILYKSKGEV